VDGAGLAVAFRLLPQGIQQPSFLTLERWLAGEQGGVQHPLLIVTPDLGTDGGCPCTGNGVVPPADAVDGVVTPIQSQPDLHHAVIVADDGRVLIQQTARKGDGGISTSPDA